jgi:cold shock CspA family protein
MFYWFRRATMTGTIHRITGTTFCFIRTPDGADYFAHRKDFAEPDKMKVGSKVECNPKLVRATGENAVPAVTDVVVVEEAA